MPITYPLSLPAYPGFVEFAWAPDSAVAVQVGEFTLQSKVYVWSGQKRRFTAKVGAIPELRYAKEWQAFLSKLNGREGTFLANDPVGSVVSGSLQDDEFSGIAVLSPGSGNEFTADGFPVGEEGLLLAGDWIAVNNRLYQLVENVDSDTAGVATLTVWPAPNGGFEADDEVKIGPEAFGEFQLTFFPESVWNREKWMEEGLTITAEEAI